MQEMLSNKRRYLTQDELKKVIKATRKGRYGQRDATRDGLRVTGAGKMIKIIDRAKLTNFAAFRLR